MSAEPTTECDREAAHRAVRDEGITACRGAFSREWVARLREDVDAAFEEARGREGGAVGRGPQRWYVEVHPRASAASSTWSTTLVDELTPITQKRTIEGLVMGEE